MEPEHDPVATLPFALGGPPSRARLRQHPEDFRVDERLDVPEHPGGAHWWLRVRKTGMNTRDAVRALSRLSSARVRQIGYAGLKDRHAVTTQWLSLPIEHLDPECLRDRLPPGLEVLEWRRARHGIRRGGLRGNRFHIRLRSVTGDRDVLERRLGSLSRGVPNYFGAQRFGRDAGNLAAAERLFEGEPGAVPRFERGLYLSAARAHLFNQVLAERVRRRCWDRLVDGELVILDGSRSVFPLEGKADALDTRLAAFDLHPSGPLHGVAGGGPCPGGACAALESEVLGRHRPLTRGLEDLRMRAERRSLRLRPDRLAWHWSGDDLDLSFDLPKGTFATTVLRELAVTIEPETGEPRDREAR